MKLKLLKNLDKIIGFIYKNNKIMPTQTMREWFNMSALGEKPKNNILKKQNKKTHREIISEIIGAESTGVRLDVPASFKLILIFANRPNNE